MEDIQIFSPSELNEAAFKELLPQFFEQIIYYYQIIREHSEIGNYNKVRRVSHKIKGCAASYSATLLFAKSKLLQETIDNKNIEMLEARVNELGKAIDIYQCFGKEHLYIS